MGRQRLEPRHATRVSDKDGAWLAGNLLQALGFHPTDLNKRLGARSPIYKKKKIAPSITGIGHLDPSSESKHAPGGTLNNHGDGSDSTWVYDPKRARVELVPLIARLHLNLGISEFEEYIQCAHDS
jgi:hypothetical protein